MPEEGSIFSKKYGNNLNCCWCWRARNEGEIAVLAVGEIKLDATKDCKADGEFLEIKEINAKGKQNVLSICGQKDPTAKGKPPKWITSSQICVQFRSNNNDLGKKRILKLAGGLIAKDKFKVKREKILTKGFGRSRTNPRKTLVEEVVATRSSAQCRLLTNEISGKQIQLDLN
jgi:hypothetical protein